MTNTVLILGSTGRFGRHTADAFETAGWTVRRFDRAREQLADAAKGADVIVAAWNPEYPQWGDLVPGLHAQVRAAARANNATVIVPGNVYVYGADTPGPWGADTPHNAQNPLGKIRRDMEAAYKADKGIRTIILRAGDFIDTKATGIWFDKIMLPTVPKGTLTYPGRVDAVHTWAFLPDLARAVVQLAKIRDELPDFSDIAFPGYAITGTQMAREIGDVLDMPMGVKTMAWWPMHFARPFMPVIKHLFEMRYLWDVAHTLDGGEFSRILPDFAITPIHVALPQALSGCDIHPH